MDNWTSEMHPHNRYTKLINQVKDIKTNSMVHTIRTLIAGLLSKYA